MNTFIIILGFIVAYLLGSIPSSVWLGKMFFNKDIRDYGSGNAGATNTIRVLGVKLGVIVLIIDALKGWVAVSIAVYFGGTFINSVQFPNYQIALGLSSVLGHVFPIFAAFRGGKGIATLLGVTIALYGYPVLCTIGVFLIIFLLSRYVSLGSIISSISFPFISYFLFHVEQPFLVLFSIIISVFVPITHRKNIIRLWNGSENKLLLKKKT